MVRFGRWSLVVALVLLATIAVHAGSGAVALKVEGKDFKKFAKKEVVLQPDATPVSLVLDDGSPEQAYWWGANTQFIWANRFTPAAGEFPFLLEEAYVVQDAAAGDMEEILVYADYDGDGEIANAVLLGRDYFSATATGLQWLGGVFSKPMACSGPGDIWIACINRTPALVAVIDSTTPGSRSFIGSNSANGSGGVESDPPAMPPGSWFPMNSYGTWMIRGFGSTYDANIVVAGSTFTDTCPRCGTGGGNGYIDWGETIILNVTFKNDGPLPATGLVATLTGSFPNITITQGTQVIGDLGVGATFNGGFVFEVPVQAMCGQALNFTVNITGNEYPTTWSSPLSFTVGNFVPGVESPVTSEDFSTWPPAGWTIGGTGLMWREGSTSGDCNSTNSQNHTGGAGPFAIADSDCNGAAMDASMISPAFSLAGAWPKAYLEFKSDYWVSGSYNAVGEVLLSTDGGATWPTVIFNYPANARGPRTEQVDISSYIGQANCAVAFHYYTDGWDWWWQVDDVRVYGKSEDFCQSFSCSPQVEGSHHGCIGSSVALGTQSALTYQWMLNGTNISGATDQTFTATVDGNYQVTTYDGVCLGTSALHPLTFHPLPTPTVTGSANGCIGVGTVHATQSYAAYQWLFNSGPIAGATSQSYTAMNSGNYSVQVTDTYGCIGVSPEFAVSIHDPVPTISGPESGCANPPVTLTTEVWTSYQWSLDGAPIPGATNQTISPTQSGTYRVTIIDNYGCEGYSGAHLFTAFIPSPTIGGPSPACVPGTLTTQAFSSYQWMLGGTDIPGATDISYNAAAAGNYSVRVTDANGCIGVSSFFDIFMAPAPTIEGGASACAGAILSTQAYTSYQWNLGGGPIAGATNQTHVAAVGGSYTVTVTNGTCPATSSPVNVFAFCPTTEVSPSSSAIPVRLVPDTSSPTGYYLYFAAASGAQNYNVYEGTIGAWYSHGSVGNICNIPYADLGGGQLRATYTPTVGNHYYLITAWGDGGEGPSGYKTGSPTPIDPSLNTCAP